MVKHGALPRSHVYSMLSSKDARVRRAAFTLLEASNPTLRSDSELFFEIIRFIWDANPSYDMYREFCQRHHLLVPFKVHELISARIKLEKREQQQTAPRGTDDTRQHKSRFFRKLLGWRMRQPAANL